MWTAAGTQLFACIANQSAAFSAHMRGLLSHWTSLVKQIFKDKLLKIQHNEKRALYQAEDVLSTRP